MFKNPFSFKGRIRRTEYGYSVIFYVTSYLFILLLAKMGELVGSIVGMLLMIPTLWFIWAQGAKRSHDRGNSGWFQIIPFYYFWLLFADSESGSNEYGPNPKGK